MIFVAVIISNLTVTVYKYWIVFHRAVKSASQQTKLAMTLLQCGIRTKTPCLPQMYIGLIQKYSDINEICMSSMAQWLRQWLA